ncbi:MAG: hypothetical protein D6824_05235, partial [Planctomycetota bacterium]
LGFSGSNSINNGIWLWDTGTSDHVIYSANQMPGSSAEYNWTYWNGTDSRRHRMRFRTVGRDGYENYQGFLWENNNSQVLMDLDADNGNLWIRGEMRADFFRDANNTSYYADPAGTSYFNDLRPNIIYDRNNTAYYVDPASTTKLNALVVNSCTGCTGTESGNFIKNQFSSAQAANFYIAGTGRASRYFDGNFDSRNGSNYIQFNNWLQIANGGVGLYWNTNGWHFYPASNQDIIVRSGHTTAGSLRLQNAGSIRGYLYWDSNSSVGFLNNAREWGLRYDTRNSYSPNLYFLESGNENWTGNPGNDTGKIEYHSNRFYIAAGANSTEIVRFRRSGSDVAMINNSGYMYAHRWYDWGNTSYYADPASTSYFNDFRASIMYDRDNTNYYANPASTSYFNDLRPNIIYDRNNTAYYVDPASTTKLNALVVNSCTGCSNGSGDNLGNHNATMRL